MKTRVCIIHKVHTRDPRSFYKHGRSLANQGYDTTIMGLYEKDEVIDGVKLVGFKPPSSRLYRFIATNYIIFMRALRGKFDIYHFHDLDFVPWAVLLKILTGSKVVYDIHEAYPEYMLIKTYLPMVTRKFLSVFVYIMEHTAAKCFDAIVPNDNYISKEFNHKKNVVIYNFPTLDFFKSADITPWAEREYDLFYHGSLPKYHVEAMMKIANKLNMDNLRNIWGLVTNDKSTVSWAKVEIEKRNLTDNFVFLPYTDFLNVYKYLLKAKIGIIPLPPYKKFMKNIPLKLFEFMGYGMPVVLSDLPPSRQFIDGENCALSVTPDNIDEYARAIKYLLNNPAIAIELGNNGKKLVFDKFNWTSEESKLMSLYENLT